MTSEQILMTDNSSASPSLLFGMIFVNWFLFGSSWQCWVSQDASDVSYSNGLKIPTQMVHEVDALPWQWRVNKFWWQIIVLPPRHCYLVWYLSIDFCSEVPGSVECHRMHRMYRIQMGWKYQLKWSQRWMLYRSNDEWTNSKDLESQVVKLWQIIVLPRHHCYLVWYLSIDFCKAVPWKLLLKPLLSPCIMCLQYRGGYDEYRGGFLEYCGGFLEYYGGYSVPWRISWVPWGYSNNKDFPPRYWTSPMLLIISPPRYSWYPPKCIMISPKAKVLKISPHSTWYIVEVIDKGILVNIWWK